MRMTLGQRGARRALGAVLLGAAALLFVPTAHAQQAAQPVYIIDADGAGPDFDMRSVRPGFDLFGGADAAHYGARATGNYGTSITNYGDCHSPLYNCQNSRVRNRRGGTTAPYFEVQWAFAAPPSQFVKIRNVAPSIANAGGGGWTAGYNQTVLGRPLRFGPHDGTLGRMFAGATSTTDGSCRDHTGFSNGTTLGGTTKSGLQILPGSDCPETWGSEGWQGAHPIDAEGWKQLFDLQGDAFTWDFWQVPEQFQRTDKMFLGTRIHTYGETSDFNVDVLANYGDVIPGGSGGSVHQGYPLGLLLHFEMFNFAVPTVAGAYFVQTTIVNRSEEVWGAPVDYDSLYFGVSMGGLFTGQNHSAYGMPELGTVVYHTSGVQGTAGPCGDAARFPYGGGCNGGDAAGYGSGVTAIVFLKSPIGDLRNKLFTKTVAGTDCAVGVDPFCNPMHPLAGDTITFQRQTYGDFGGAEAFTWGTGARAAFGLMAASEVNTLAGRNPGDFNDRTLYTTFRSEDWTTNKVRYNKYVPPGGWDYNKDGVLDTLAIDTCGRFGCVVVDSDTMPGGWINRRGNIGGLQSFGPFSLAANDTTSLVYAHLGEIDSVQFWSALSSVIDLYQNFYLSPEAPPPAQVASVQLTPGTDALGTANPEVEIFFSDDPERWTDPFLTKVAEDIEAAADGTPLKELADLNGGPVALANLVRARASDNFDRLEVYKSCDGGNSFTSDGNCDGDPATRVSGQGDVFGWRTYAQFGFDQNQGDIPNVFSDNQVDGGRTYLYVFIAKSRGATFLLNTTSGPDSVSFAPAIWNPLSTSTSDPNVVSVYVPASKPAGYQPAAVTFTSIPTATVPFTPNVSDNVATAPYRAVFGNEIQVRRDSSISAGEPLQSIVTISNRATVDAGGVPSSQLIDTESFTFASPNVFIVSGTGTTLAPTTNVDTVFTTTVYDGLGFVIAGPAGPVFASQTLTGDAATPATLFGRAEYPGFTITANNALAGDHNANAEAQVRGPITLAEQGLEPFDSIVPRGNVVNPFMVQWMEGDSDREPDGGGNYTITWADDPWGVERGFVLNLNNPGATEAEVQATLAARNLPTTGLVDASTAALLNVDQTDLVAVKAPFTIRNTTFNRDVQIAMQRRVSNRVALGALTDTISVEVQGDQWVPGDALFFVEDVTEDSTTAVGLVLDASGQPVQRTRTAQTFSAAVLGCQQVRLSCNPVLQTTAGATGYAPMREGDMTRFAYYVGFSSNTEYAFDLTAPVTGSQITQLTDSALALIRVVPNPFVIFSQYQTSAGNARILFTNVPSTGTLRIYTVAGQLVQQITWEPADLLGDGDLFWDLKTRENIDIASGLYLWVLTAPSNPSNTASTPITARGKFVVIRGDER